MNQKNLWVIFLMITVIINLIDAQEPVIPNYHATQIIAASKSFPSENYLGFPAILRLNDDEILISFKRGLKHGGDLEASLEMIRFDTKYNKIIEQKLLARDSGLIHQMGEWVKFPDGTIRLYIDSQNLGHDGRNYRTGMREVNLRKKNNYFIPSRTKLSPIVGERMYGYPFDFIVSEHSTYMLVMGFGYLPGNKWSVDVIKSDDNGDSWSLVNDLTQEFGDYKINESAFIPWGTGYVVTTREYGHSQRVYLTDKNFKMVQQSNISQDNDFIESHIGRPRLFTRDGSLYLLGRNWRTTEKEGRKMELALFKINPETLKIDKWVILDNYDRANVSDGYYGVPYFQKRNGIIYFNVIDYKGVNNRKPDILRHEFIWEEIK